jgi:hypothetical protein
MIASFTRHKLSPTETGRPPPMGERTDACEARAAECTEAAERAALRGHKPIEMMYLSLARQWQILAQQAAELERKHLRGPEPDSSGVNDFRIKIFFARRGGGRPVTRDS